MQTLLDEKELICIETNLELAYYTSIIFIGIRIPNKLMFF